jgi:hypothetical protein
MRLLLPRKHSENHLAHPPCNFTPANAICQMVICISKLSYQYLWSKSQHRRIPPPLEIPVNEIDRFEKSPEVNLAAG